MKLFHNFVTYFNVIWVICGEITYTSNIYEIDAAKLNSKVFSIHNFLLILKFLEYGPLAQYGDFLIGQCSMWILGNMLDFIDQNETFS